MKRWGVVLAAMAALLLSACVTPQLAPPEQDAKAKEFAAVSGKAGLYVYRNENFGGAVPMSVAVNGGTLGETGAKTYF